MVKINIKRTPISNYSCVSLNIIQKNISSKKKK